MNETNLFVFNGITLNYRLNSMTHVFLKSERHCEIESYFEKESKPLGQPNCIKYSCNFIDWKLIGKKTTERITHTHKEVLVITDFISIF